MPIIIQINARRRVSLVKINARFFPVGNMTLLINLKKAEHRNIEMLSLLFSLFAPLKSKFTAYLKKKMEGKQKLVRKICSLSV